jgi:hypothetical protein
MRYTKIMKDILTYLMSAYVIGMTAYVIWAETKLKEKDFTIAGLKQDLIWFGYKENARDGDGDGIVQEGTKWERKAKKK